MNNPDSSLTVPVKYLAFTDKGFQITGISEKGNLYFNNDETRLVDIKATAFSAETSLRSDEQTAWEFFFEGIMFSALPGSMIHYTPQTSELLLGEGEFYWENKLGRKNIEISILKAGNMFRISISGRLRLSEKFLEIWNYSGEVNLDYNGKPLHLKELQYLKYSSTGKLLPIDLFPAPSSISPENKTISLIHTNDTNIQFNWKNVRGAGNYLLKIYPSPLRDNILASKLVAGNSIILDILPFIDYNELYWEVAAFDEIGNVESVPARMGVIKISSSMLKKGMQAQPPKIEVNSLSVSGNMVLIKGNIDPNARLSIEGIVIKLDNDGKFIHTISYKSIGIKDIVFRAIAPSGLETVLKKQVTIFEE